MAAASLLADGALHGMITDVFEQRMRASDVARAVHLCRHAVQRNDFTQLVNRRHACGRGLHTPLTLSVRYMGVADPSARHELLVMVRILAALPEVDVHLPYVRFPEKVERTAAYIAARSGLADAASAIAASDGSADAQVAQWMLKLDALLVRGADSDLAMGYKTASLLTPDLFLGSMGTAVQTTAPAVQGVLNCCRGVADNAALHAARGQAYHAFAAEDVDEYPVLDVHLDEACAFIASVNGAVFVHCFAGVNRSATICVAYLMRQYRWPLSKAVAHVHARRPIVLTNLSFRKQLVRFAAREGLLA
eukprot:TRINITY_DN5873_c0_g1_i1.p1 TRINITY_DN5873_c0_g1~~TRINITY_DN5873_c0_g1_i1.p1  ORF type:complete len:306 (+),score=66.95 TRINITY_DN5873_c0_g1_i1:700-1617(+)